MSSTQATEDVAAVRARAASLRRETDDQTPDSADGTSPVKRWWRLSRSTVVALVAMLAGTALFAASGYMWWGHRAAELERQRRDEFAAAAAQAVITLMSIDSAKAQENVRQIIDNSAGQFRDDFQVEAEDFVKTAQASKAVTKATAQAEAVQVMAANSATVLVAAATTVSNSAGANQQPRNWRLSVDMVQDGEQIKLTKVEFVP
ncbi:hypothetical protein ACXPWS_10510 [Mycobacterium sp. BMJ-28]